MNLSFSSFRLSWWWCFLLSVVLLGSCHNGNSTAEQEDSEAASNVPPQIKNLTEQISKDSSNATLYFARGAMYVQSNDATSATKDFVKAIRLDSMQANYYLAAAEVYFNSGLAPQSVLILERGERNLPTDLRLKTELAKSYYAVQKYAEAKQRLDAVIVADSQNPTAYFWRAMFYKDQEKSVEAIQDLQKAVEIDPQYYQAMMMLAQMYARKGDTKAIEYFDKAAKLDSTSSEAMYAKSMFLQENGKLDQAIANYQKLIEQDPQNKDAFYNLGYIYYNQNELKKAYQHFDLATKMDPVFAKAYYMRGLCAEKMGKANEAKSDYNKAITFDENLQLAKDALQKLEGK
jgi:Tfp pilus assembly protein PilF